MIWKTTCWYSLKPKALLISFYYRSSLNSFKWKQRPFRLMLRNVKQAKDTSMYATHWKCRWTLDKKGLTKKEKKNQCPLLDCTYCRCNGLSSASLFFCRRKNVSSSVGFSKKHLKGLSRLTRSAEEKASGGRIYNIYRMNIRLQKNNDDAERCSRASIIIYTGWTAP